MNNLILIRHGHAYNQVLDIVAGDAEFPLTEKGLRQAKIMEVSLREYSIDNVYCSTVLRCQETTKYIESIFPEAKFEYTDSLREINVGGLSHTKYSDFAEMEEYKDFGYLSETPFPNGESFKGFQERVEGFLNSLPELETIAVVSHSGVINLILHKYYDIDFSYFPFFNVKNCVPYILKK